MNKIYDTIELATNVTVTLENRYSENKDNYYDCVCLNVADKSVIIAFGSQTFNILKKNLK